MGDSSSSSGDVFEVRKIRRLVELMNEHELSEIDLRQGETRIRLRRGNDVILAGGTSYPAAPAGGEVREPAAAPPAPAAAPAAAADSAHVHQISSPMVGTFYTSSSPENPPFVKVGDHVGPETIVCIVEAMKVFNEIPAGISGKVQAVLVENGEPVEYGQPLFKIDTRK
jgi:acetyl-CoA carboxylase biotin carboxyl carrier protein